MGVGEEVNLREDDSFWNMERRHFYRKIYGNSGQYGRLINFMHLQESKSVVGTLVIKNKILLKTRMINLMHLHYGRSHFEYF